MVKQRADGGEGLCLQPHAKHRLMVVLTTIKEVDMDAVRHDMWGIIHER